MNIYEVSRAEQTGIIEITGIGIKCVKGSLSCVVGIAISADNVEPQPKPWLPSCLPSVAAIQARGPRENRVTPKTAHLNDIFLIPIPLVTRTKEAEAKRMPMLISISRSLGCLVVMTTEIIQVHTLLALGIEPVCDIKPPKSRRMIRPAYFPRILDRLS